MIRDERLPRGHLSKRCGFNFPLPDLPANSGMDISCTHSLFFLYFFEYSHLNRLLQTAAGPLVHVFVAFADAKLTSANQSQLGESNC